MPCTLSQGTSSFFPFLLSPCCNSVVCPCACPVLCPLLFLTHPPNATLKVPSSLAQTQQGGKRIHHALAEMTEGVFTYTSSIGHSVTQGIYSTASSIGSGARWLVDTVSFRRSSAAPAVDAPQHEGIRDGTQDAVELPVASGEAGETAPCFMGRLAGGAPVGTAGFIGGRGARGRVDFVLQETVTESTVSIYAAMGAHFMYWDSADVGLFVARAVLGMDVLEEVRGPVAAPAVAEVTGLEGDETTVGVGGGGGIAEVRGEGVGREEREEREGERLATEREELLRRRN